MNERIRVRLVQNGKQLAINSLTQEGVMLNNEADAWPRGMMLEFDANNPITKSRMDRIRTIRGWDPMQFNLNCMVDSGDLVFSGADHDTLPAGGYWIRLRIGDLVLPKRQTRVDLKTDGETLVQLDATEDPRTVELTDDVADFDPEIARVLLSTGTTIDGMSASDWLSNPTRRPRRKACLLNLLAKLRTAPTLTNPLITDVRRIFFCAVDRIFASVEANFFTRLDALARDPKKPFMAEGTPKSASHRDLLSLVQNRGLESNVDRYDLKSFRQEGRPSMQAVVGIPPSDFVAGRYYSDIDIDLGNPLQDVQGLIIHAGELLDPGETDHLAMRKQLGNDKKIAPFLYYKVVKD